MLVSRNKCLIELVFKDEETHKIKKALSVAYPEGIESADSFRKICDLLDRYFKGGRVDFEVNTDISRLGEFTRKVLDETKKIPYGEVRSYGWIGKKLGYKNAARAVGQALGRNPIPIVIPCHRVVGGDGSIGGFSSGISIKEKLLSIEGSLSNVQHKTSL